jgi:hypothetical protein
MNPGSPHVSMVLVGLKVDRPADRRPLDVVFVVIVLYFMLISLFADIFVIACCSGCVGKWLIMTSRYK